MIRSNSDNICLVVNLQTRELRRVQYQRELDEKHQRLLRQTEWHHVPEGRCQICGGSKSDYLGVD